MTYAVPGATAKAGVDAITALINVGSANATGAIQLRSSGALIATLNFNNPAFAAASGSTGIAAMGTSPAVSGTVTPSGSSTIDRFRFVNRDVTTIIDGNAGSVAVTGADINLSSVVVNQNDVVEITGLNMSIPLTGP